MNDKDCAGCTKIIEGDPCFGGKVSTIDYCVPTPSIDAFNYEADMGVLRTTVATGKARQRRLYTDQPRRYDLSWVLTTGQLNVWEGFAQKYGYNWHFLPMVTGQLPMWFPVDHPIRYIGNYQVDLLQKDLWEVNVQAEQYDLDPECMFNLLCDEMRACLQKSFVQVEADWSAFSAALGSKTVWGAPNG